MELSEMKLVVRTIITSILALLGFGCAGEADRQHPKVERVDTATLKPGPIQHEELSAEQLRRIEHLHELLAEVDPSSLETWTDNFKRDMHPDKEIAVWERIAKAYTNYTSQRKLSLDAKKDVLQTLLVASMSSDDEGIKSLKLKVISQDEARLILKTF
jgi:hypothetical protein